MEYIYLINVVNYQLTSHIKIENIVAISAIIKLNNGNILIGCKKDHKSKEEEISYIYSLIEYEYNFKEKTLIKVRSKENAHDNIITGLLNLNHNEIVSCSLDKTIKEWTNKMKEVINQERKVDTKRIKEAGYDIVTEAKKLEEKYLNLIK